MTVWIVVADAARARFLSADKPNAALVEVEDRVHSASRLHARDLVTERAPRVHDSHGLGRHAIEPATDVKTLEAESFAREVSQHLEDSRSAGRYQKLYLIAAPQFLGQLRGSLSHGVKSLIAGETDKNLTQHTVAEIRAQLPQYL
ncbi:MAG: host attachment protein [Thiotrichales bacterium]